MWMRVVVWLALVGGAARADVGKLGWMAGRWVSDDGAAEETWGPAVGDNMLGMFRLVREGTAKFYELLALQREGERTVLRMRHFGRDFSAMEGEAMVYALAEVTAGEAVFTHPTDAVRRIVYRREGARLTVTLERAGGKNDVFRFVRR